MIIFIDNFILNNYVGKFNHYSSSSSGKLTKSTSVPVIYLYNCKTFSVSSSKWLLGVMEFEMKRPEFLSFYGLGTQQSDTFYI